MGTIEIAQLRVIDLHVGFHPRFIQYNLEPSLPATARVPARNGGPYCAWNGTKPTALTNANVDTRQSNSDSPRDC